MDWYSIGILVGLGASIGVAAVAVLVRTMGNISVTFDHRVVDGARAAAFTLAVIAKLTN